MPGFKTFHLLKGATTATHTLYASHSVWESRAAFVAWTQSECVPQSARAGESAQRHVLSDTLNSRRSSPFCKRDVLDPLFKRLERAPRASRSHCVTYSMRCISATTD